MKVCLSCSYLKKSEDKQRLIAGGVAGGLANVVCYPFDFARTRLASDLGKGQGQFNGIADCIMKTVKTGFCISLIFLYISGCGTVPREVLSFMQ